MLARVPQNLHRADFPKLGTLLFSARRHKLHHAAQRIWPFQLNCSQQRQLFDRQLIHVLEAKFRQSNQDQHLNRLILLGRRLFFEPWT